MRSITKQQEAVRQIPRLGVMDSSDGFYRGRVEGALGDSAWVLLQDLRAVKDAEPLDGETSGQIEVLMGSLLAQPEALRKAIATELLASHGAWFEDQPMSIDELTKGMSLRTVRIKDDIRSLSLEINHQVFSGHVVQVALTTNGAVEYVGLLG